MSTPNPEHAASPNTGWWSVKPCDWGWVLVARTAQGVCAVSLGENAQELEQALHQRWPRMQWLPDTPSQTHSTWSAATTEIARWINAPHSPWRWPLDIRGTPFQMQVWEALRRIPAGTVVSYQTLAQELGRPTAARAVAQACAANPLAVVIPCHRVVRQDGGLGGYRWGIARKQRLLALEAA